MIITKITDGLGNQMFQYACGYAAAKRLNTQLFLDYAELSTSKIRTYELDKFNIEYDKVLSVKEGRSKPFAVLERRFKRSISSKKCVLFSEKEAYVYDKSIRNISDNTYIQGYWQSEKYFREYRADLLKLFSLSFELSTECKNYLEAVSSCNSVAVHIRCGDYKKIGACIEREYYEVAIEGIKKCVENPVFYVFSDDISSARELLGNINEKFDYVSCSTVNAAIEEMTIMRSCKHQIIANSTFSWWAAWLNDNASKVVVCPEYKQWTGDFYPDNWLKIRCVGGYRV